MLNQTAEVEGILPPAVCESSRAGFSSLRGYASALACSVSEAYTGISRLGAPRVFRYRKAKNISAVLPLPRDKCCLKVQLRTLRPQIQSEKLPLEEEMALKNGSEQPLCDLVGYSWSQ